MKTIIGGKTKVAAIDQRLRVERDASKVRPMRIEVLGAQGGEMPGCRATAFRIDGCLALDAGGLASALSIEEQCQLDHVLITHPHLDHIKDLAFVSDLIIGRREGPLCVHAAPGTVAALRSHFFNNVIWPDFTAIPTRSAPVMQLKSLDPLREHDVGGYIVRALPVTHTVEAMGFVISRGSTTVAFSGDTGPTELFWEELNHLPRLDALFIEVSFPNSLQGIADASLHFTPQSLDKELKKLNRADLPVVIQVRASDALLSVLITDEGGIACHAAIVSRELGLPCIIGTKIATKAIKDGDLVEMDMEKGIVKILKRG